MEDHKYEIFNSISIPTPTTDSDADPEDTDPDEEDTNIITINCIYSKTIHIKIIYCYSSCTTI